MKSPVKLRRATGWLGLAVVVCAVAATLAAPILATRDPLATDPVNQFAPPSADYPLGTDLLGRDVFSRALWGGRASLSAAMVASALAAAFGLAVGGTSALAGGWWDWLLMRLVDMLLALPGLLLAIALVALLGVGRLQVALAVGLSLGPGFARVARAAMLDVMRQGYVEAAQATGAKASRIFMRHILPNAAPQLMAFTITTFSWALLNLAALDFLGLSGSPSDPSWGRMLAEGRPYLRDAPWILLTPGVMLAVSVVGLTLFDEMPRKSRQPERNFV